MWQDTKKLGSAAVLASVGCTFLISLRKARLLESCKWGVKATGVGAWGNKAAQCSSVNQNALNSEMCLIEMCPKKAI